MKGGKANIWRGYSRNLASEGGLSNVKTWHLLHALKALSNRQAPQYQGFDLLVGKENVESWLTPTLSTDLVFDSFPAS